VSLSEPTQKQLAALTSFEGKLKSLDGFANGLPDLKVSDFGISIPSYFKQAGKAGFAADFSREVRPAVASATTVQSQLAPALGRTLDIASSFGQIRGVKGTFEQMDALRPTLRELTKTGLLSANFPKMASSGAALAGPAFDPATLGIASAMGKHVAAMPNWRVTPAPWRPAERYLLDSLGGKPVWSNATARAAERILHEVNRAQLPISDQGSGSQAEYESRIEELALELADKIERPGATELSQQLISNPRLLLALFTTVGQDAVSFVLPQDISLAFTITLYAWGVSGWWAENGYFHVSSDRLY